MPFTYYSSPPIPDGWRRQLIRLALVAALACGLSVTAEEPPNHWAWQPVVEPPLPAATVPGWDHPVDRFIARDLQAAGIQPGEPAQPATLLRRAKLDLLGLPPTYDEIAEFAKGGQSFSELVQTYLQDPAYGERWGRHWLDVARYADTRGHVFFGKEPRFPFSYTYRDYVIDAINRDLPFDRFIKEQIAADQLPDRRSDADLAALGFLTVGEQFNGKRNLIIDDQIDVVSRGFMALTVACSRCHDHKADPIPIADYYSLYGVFASSHVPEDLPVIGEPRDAKAHQTYLDKRQKLLNELAATLAQQAREARADVRKKNADYLQRAFDGNYKKETVALRGGQVRKWRHILEKLPDPLQPILGPVAAVYANRKAEPRQTIDDYLAKHAVNPVIADRLRSSQIRNHLDAARVVGEVLTESWQKWQATQKGENKPAALPQADWEAIRQVLLAENGPVPHSDAAAKGIFGQVENQKVRDKEVAIAKHEASSRGAPPRAMVVNDGRVVEPVVFKRGDPNNRGERVPRQFLSLLSGPERQPFTQGSGRLELAEAIVDPANPLTARTIVNRVWHWHFGTGLVRTVDNFGVLGETPSHPELLDYLATAFVRHGWSLKWLHHHLMTSRTYQQASTLRAEARAKDPENRLWWRFPRRRIEFEALRDGILAVSGALDASRGGHAFDLHAKPYVTRRTVYAFVDRGKLAYELPIFDFAPPGACTGKRPRTTVPQQALYLLNGDFVLSQAKRLNGDQETQAQAPGKTRITYLFRRILARDPSPAELEQTLAFIAGTPAATKPGAYVQVIQALLAGNEFSFID